MIPISAVIVTLDEERNIGRCIDSLVGVVDEIVVVDSYSTDRTKDICLEKGARFIQHAFEGYIEQKNWALTQAQHDHVLSLDADEALSGDLQASILEAKKNWKADGYSMNRLTNYCGSWIRHCGWYPDRKMRLFDRRRGKWGGLNPHDIFLLEPGGKSLHLQGDILHYSYYSFSDHLKQVDHFTTIGARAAFERGKKASWIKWMISPPLKFARDFFFKLGFLDGFHGFAICRISAMATFLKYAKLRDLHEIARSKK